MRQYIFGALVVAGIGAQFGVATMGAQEGGRTTNDGVYTEEQAKRGGSLYEKNCTSCHGSGMEGIEMAPPLVGSEFDANWNKAQLSDLSERIRVSMPQDKPGSLSRQQTVDVLAYILAFNKVPAGKTELPLETEALRAITIIRQ